MNVKVRKLELLAPARDMATAIAAIDHGADAVYIGAPAFGARAAAGNSIDDLTQVVDYAHKFGARVYVTLNTIIYDNELEQVSALIRQLYDIGVDALIVQDLGILNMDIPPIELHASTQTDARTADKIALLAKAGFSQIVVPREFSLEQIKEAVHTAEQYQASIEVFVHGALCVSYSGDCHAGAVLTGRSANRGECPQICRLQYKLTDSVGRRVKLPDNGSDMRYWLSLADMNRLGRLAELVDAGATSFKIEGRLKSVSYVKNVTAAYSRALDEIVANSGGRLARASYGRTTLNFKPDATKSFNRGFTDYFLNSQVKDYTGISSWKTPKWIGRPIAKTIQIKGKSLIVKATEPVNNGDGIGYFDEGGNYIGFRVNRVEGNVLYPAPGSKFPARAGVTLYRNADVEHEARMERKDSSIRSIALTMTLRRSADHRIVLDVADERGNSISVATENTYSDTARTPQDGQRRSILERLGDTIYLLENLDDRLGDVFVPSKDLTALRRSAVSLLDDAWHIRYERHYRKKSQLEADALSCVATSYHDNVANHLSEGFYCGHGAKINEKAIEVCPAKGSVRVMTTRYCLRRSLGACLKTPDRDKLPQDLYLEAPIGRLRLEFDCKNCNMQVYYDN